MARRRRESVFPTPVGVFLLGLMDGDYDSGLPHARGGVSIASRFESDKVGSSPRPWGCFSPACALQTVPPVFPTPVGVFLPLPTWRLLSGRLPHARGGVSVVSCHRYRQGRSSPRPWGCFSRGSVRSPRSAVFPTPVGVFLRLWFPYSPSVCLPHARGGVSQDMALQLARSASSPRPWGCFRFPLAGAGRDGVFPTPVGVFPRGRLSYAFADGLPHARGGVSFSRLLPMVILPSSPRPWGCFWLLKFHHY